MAGEIEGIGAVAQAMTNDITMSNPGLATDEGGGVALSEVAARTLAGIERLQESFDRAAPPDPSSALSSSVATESASPVDGALRSAERLMASIEQSTNVQSQLAQFVMASSISSSLGNNLNMFLRGQ